jgi:hypothetical protein
MGKYSDLKILKKTKARTPHVCTKCDGNIPPGEYYYKEHIDDKFLQSLHAKKYCTSCYEQYGESLLSAKNSR